MAGTGGATGPRPRSSSQPTFRQPFCEERTVPVLPGAEPFTAEGSGDLAGVGVVLCHGFTGNPSSVRPWGEYLAEAGLAVAAPRLPGHGTRWQDMNLTRWEDWYGELDRTFEGLKSRCDTVFAMGLSMGGTLTLRLLQEHGADVAGAVLVNASLATERKDAKLLPLLAPVLASRPGVGSDIAKPTTAESAYDRVPLKAALSLSRLWKVVRADLGEITQPMLVFRSRNDHVVEPVSCRLLLEGVRSDSVQERVLERSYHVATLDYDAPAIFEGSLDFVRQHVGAAAPAPARAAAP
jgi:carboxylesterase